MNSGFHRVAREDFKKAQVRSIEKPKRKKRVSDKSKDVADIRRRREELQDELMLKRDISEVWF